MSLIAELKRRNVFRVGVAYAIVAWLLAAVSSSGVISLVLFALPGQAGAVTIYETGFENPPFSLGPLAGQDGWNDRGNPANISVQNAVARDGVQAVQFDADGASGQMGSLHHDNLETAGSALIEVTVDIFRERGGTPSGAADLAGFDGSSTDIGFMRWSADDSLSVHFGMDKSVRIKNALTKDNWFTFTLAFDFSTRRFDALLDNASVADDLPFFGSSTDTVFHSGGIFVQGPGTDRTFYDNYSVVAITEPAQNSAQKACINANNKSVAKLAKRQGKTAGACIKNAARGKLAALGVPPQEQTAQACLDNDVGAKVQRSIGKLLARDATHCRAASSQLPDFGYDDADASIAGGRGGVIDLIEELFGSDLDAALVAAASDKIGAKCQRKAQKAAQKFFGTLWKSALRGQKNALKKNTTRNTIRFQIDILAFLATDTKLSSAATKLEGKLVKACSAVSDLAPLFPGACSTANLGTFSNCVREAARCRFCGSLNEADRLGIDCDDFDNGISDGSC